MPARDVCEVVPHVGRTFFDGLGTDLQTELMALTRTRRYPARSIILFEGERPNLVHIIRSGVVKVTVAMGPREVILDVLGAGDVLGDLSVVDGGERSATATTMRVTETASLDALAFGRFLAEHQQAKDVLLRDVVRRLREASRRQVESGALDGVGRVCRRLVELSDRFGRPRGTHTMIDGPLSQSDIAAWAGLSREAVVKALQTLRTLGWIRTDGRTLVVVDGAAVRLRASIDP